MRPVAQTDSRVSADCCPGVDGAPAVWRIRILAVALGLIAFSSADRAWAGCGEYVLVEGQTQMAEHPNFPDAPRCPNGECRRGESKPLVPIVPVTLPGVDHWATLFASVSDTPHNIQSRIAPSDAICESACPSLRERPPRRA